MMTINTTFKTTYDIPMTETQYKLLKESFKDISPSFEYTIDYDEDFQQAHICCDDGAWLEQTHEEYIFTERRGCWRNIINKRTGEVSVVFIYTFDKARAKDSFAEGLNRVYGTYDRDFISDELKSYLKWYDEELMPMLADPEQWHAVLHEI